jgi:hypothetical protein
VIYIWIGSDRCWWTWPLSVFVGTKRNRWPPLLHFAALSLRETLCVGQGVEEMTNALDNTIGLHKRPLHYDSAVNINYSRLINEHSNHDAISRLPLTEVALGEIFGRKLTFDDSRLDTCAICLFGQHNNRLGHGSNDRFSERINSTSI